MGIIRKQLVDINNLLAMGATKAAIHELENHLLKQAELTLALGRLTERAQRYKNFLEEALSLTKQGKLKDANDKLAAAKWDAAKMEEERRALRGLIKKCE